MTYQLRDYQLEAREKALWFFENYNSPFIIQAATGAGKSLMIADVCYQLDEPVLVLQPSKELLEQNFAKLVSYDPMIDAGIYSASKNLKQIRKFTYATIGSIYKKPELFKDFKYVIIDECHLVNPKSLGGMYMTFLKAIDCQHVLGLTATPYRLQQKFFKEDGELFYTSHLKMINRIHPFFFKKIVYKIETDELIQRGYLCPIKYRSDEVDWNQLEVNSTGADFTELSLERFWGDDRMKKLALTIQMIDKHCKRNLIFCSSLRQAGKAQEMLKAMGIESFVVTGKTPKKEREQMVYAFKQGVVRHMINVGVFTTGFDVPELDCIVLARPTMSLALYYQMVGRGVRIDPKNPDKMLRVFDFAGCVRKLGKVENIKIVKEEDGFRDKVVSNVGDMTEVPLFTFGVKDKKYEKMA